MKKLLWITGAGKGIGRAVAQQYAQKGWHVAVSSRTQDDLISLKEHAKSLLGKDLIHCYPLDITSKESYEEVYREIKSELKIPDQLIFNAGTHIPSPAISFSSRIYEKLMTVNYFGTLYGVETVIADLLDNNKGHIGIVSSVAGYRGLPNSSAYGASKAALINFCESLRIDLDKTNINISIINPGFVKTPLTDKNDFSMPFIISAEKAAAIIFKGMEEKRFEIAFPRLFVSFLKLLRIIPYFIYFRIIKKYTNV